MYAKALVYRGEIFKVSFYGLFAHAIPLDSMSKERKTANYDLKHNISPFHAMEIKVRRCERGYVIKIKDIGRLMCVCYARHGTQFASQLDF